MYSNAAKYDHTCSQNNIFLGVFKVCKPQKRADQLTELFNVFELKIQNFFLLLWYLPGFVWASTKFSQTKLLRLFPDRE